MMLDAWVVSHSFNIAGLAEMKCASAVETGADDGC